MQVSIQYATNRERVAIMSGDSHVVIRSSSQWHLCCLEDLERRHRTASFPFTTERPNAPLDQGSSYCKITFFFFRETFFTKCEGKKMMEHTDFQVAKRITVTMLGYFPGTEIE